MQRLQQQGLCCGLRYCGEYRIHHIFSVRPSLCNQFPNRCDGGESWTVASRCLNEFPTLSRNASAAIPAIAMQ